ncbi:MAG TPA: c-type cytochrome [Bryobacteraceae bacterium]|jgi:hypothetical protein|nr:c-type cytochrome [Bryobacteraceae bacterium]
MRLLLALVPLLMLGAQEKAPEKQAKAPLPPPTNLKVLKVTTGQEVGQIMRTFTVGLGVQCIYCHVQGNFASDDNPKKEIARHMITMTQQVNGNFSEGKLRVSCYTCHRGEPEPKTAPEPRAGR